MNVIVERDVTAEMRDGVHLAANVYRPDGDDRHPVLLMRLPYGKDVYSITHLALDPIRAAAAGYVVVHQDCRGRGNSEGVFDPFRDELDDGFDSVEWAAAHPSSNGEVGIYGVSYPGLTAWAAAAAGPPGLRAAAPSQAPLRHRALLWRGGAFELGLFLFWTAFYLGIPELARRRAEAPTFRAELEELAAVTDDFERSADLFERGELRLGPVDVELLPYFEEGPDQTADELHSPRTIEDPVGAVGVPMLVTAGWNDLLLHQDLAAFAELQARPEGDPVRERSRLLVGPWTHGPGMHLSAAGEVDFGVRAGGMSLDLAGDMTRHHLDFFDAELRGGGPSAQAPVRIFTMGRNRWREEEEWPPRGAREEAWYLGPEGDLGHRPPSSDASPREFLHDPDDPCPTRGGRIMLPLRYPRGPVDQRPVLGRDDVLLYRSEQLDSELEVTGEVRVVLFAATSGRAADWVVKLCDVRPDGRVFNVCDGVLRAHTQFGEFEIALGGTSFAFAAGHRLGLIVSSSDYPRYDRNPNASAGRQLVFADRDRPSRIVLPVIG
jgi:uncharacterized protein